MIMYENNARSILKKLESGYQLPPFSKTAVKLIELAADEATSLNELCSLIEKDPSLTIRVLKLANGAFFKSLSPVTTIQQAVLRIGFRQLRLLALSLSIKDAFPMDKSGRINYDLFWKTSLYRGLLAKGLASKFNVCPPEEAFVAGLILEIGLLIYHDLFLKNTDEDIDLNMHSLEILLSMEKERHGITHREIGETALKFWKFPEEIIMCQRYCYEKDNISKMPELARICSMSERLSVLICHENAHIETTIQELTSAFGVVHDEIYDVVINSMDEVDKTAQALNMKVHGENDLLALMEKANRALIRISECMCDDKQRYPLDDLPTFDTLKTEPEKQNMEVIKTLQAVAHEIKNPLTAVSGFARRLAKTIDPSSEGWRYVEIILKEAQRLEFALNEATRGLQKGIQG